ncbi:hypothetical protein CAPTEDRAFT_187281 [Capitella teleta]|uniref:LRRCT domain-containing protein n=1 Tax=Capitella teleta TaxID=283909 RepID=X1ZK37_CAPTE|nr:hypothetical protein CAPTEDRAFT_187281 [Capitella teleta]|eukprot:ELU10116.1 hypothetical protein CAPTEDRAFT_187281 [Capitella teleta]
MAVYITAKIFLLCSALCSSVKCQPFLFLREHAGLTEIPTDIPLDVRAIILSQNLITNIGPKAFSKFKSLIALSIESNNINVIHDDAFDGLTNLTSLQLSNNKLDRVPKLKYLELEHLSLYGNNIQLYHNSFEDVTVNELLLHSNKITNLSPIMELSESLEIVRVRSNPLGNSSSADLYNLMQSLTKSRRIILSSCGLTTFPDVSLLNYSDVFQLFIANNPFECDARIAWLKDTPIDVRDYTSIRCASPSRHLGKLLHDIPLEELYPGKFLIKKGQRFFKISNWIASSSLID